MKARKRKASIMTKEAKWAKDRSSNEFDLGEKLESIADELGRFRINATVRGVLKMILLNSKDSNIEGILDINDTTIQDSIESGEFLEELFEFSDFEIAEILTKINKRISIEDREGVTITGGKRDRYKAYNSSISLELGWRIKIPLEKEDYDKLKKILELI